MRRYPVLRVFLTVTAGAIAGMVMGGLFGRWAGSRAPEVFAEFVERHQNAGNPGNPIETGTVLGAAGGTFLGGGLAAFGIVVAVAHAWIASREAPRPPTA